MMESDLGPFLARERAAAIQWARDLMGRGDWLILDTETTGLGPEAEIVEIGILSRDGEILLNAQIRTRRPIPAEATAIHGITNERVRYLDSYHRWHPWIYWYLHGRLAVIYNAAYDVRILHQTATSYDLPLPVGAYACAMEQYARFVGEWSDYHQSFRWQKLPPVPGESAHSAIADCRATLALIKRMAEAKEDGE